MMIAAIYTSFMGTGCAHYRLKDKEVDESFSFKGTGRELSRGVTNMAFCWLELPHEIECKIRDNNPDAPFGMISSSIAAALGAIKGTLWTVDRFVGGAVEIAFSPFPPYDPIMHPGYPPYLNFKKRKQSEDQERLSSADFGDLPSTGTAHIKQDRADSHIEEDNPCIEKITRDITFKETGTLEMSNSNGSIKCRDTSGKVDVTNSNGKITFDKPRGPIRAHSTNGSIDINELQLEYISSDICCKTANGGIRISLSNESEYKLNATHVNGKFECDFPITIEEQSREHIRGRVGEGGPKIELSTVNGSIL
jgi:putative exosortase-associated protein (TIGR04073 family)